MSEASGSRFCMMTSSFSFMKPQNLRFSAHSLGEGDASSKAEF